MPVPMVRLDMISDRCRNSQTFCCAHSAQWFDDALSARDPSPSLKLIPIPMTTIVHVTWLLWDRLASTNLSMRGRRMDAKPEEASLASDVRSQKETCQGGSETRCTAGFPLF